MLSLFCEWVWRLSSPYINHFLQPDTIIPNPANPQSWNRYAYVHNNPVRFNDPMGHKAGNSDSESSDDCVYSRSEAASLKADLAQKYKVYLKKDGWDDNNIKAVYDAVELVGSKFASERGLGESDRTAFVAVYDHIEMKWEGGAGMCGDDPADSGGCTDGAHQIRFWSLSGHGQSEVSRMAKNVVHELGHAFDWTQGRPSNNMSPDFTRDTLLRPNLRSSDGQRWEWQQSDRNTDNEIFADIFIAWTYNVWNTDPVNAANIDDAKSWMNGLVP